MEIKKNTAMRIGIYQINIMIDKEETPLSLPPASDAFLEDTKNQCTHEINYIIKTRKPLEIPEGEPVAQFDHGPIPYKIYRYSNLDYLWIRYCVDKINLAYLISKDWSTWELVEDNSEDQGDSSFGELAYIFGYSVLNKNGIMFHGVVMDWNGLGIIVCAHSGVGKTTHTRMWRDHEAAVILNGDRALCYRQEKHWYACGAPWCGTSEEYQNRSVRLSYIVLIERGEDNEVIVLSPFQGAMELLKLTFAPDWEEQLLCSTLEDIDQIVLRIPVIKLRCRPDLDSVSVLKDAIMKI